MTEQTNSEPKITDLKPGDRFLIEIAGRKEPLHRFGTYLKDGWCVLDESISSTEHKNGYNTFSNIASTSSAFSEWLFRSGITLPPHEKTFGWNVKDSAYYTTIKRILPKDGEIKQKDLVRGDRLEIELTQKSDDGRTTTINASYVGNGWIWLDRVPTPEDNLSEPKSPSTAIRPLPTDILLPEEHRLWHLEAPKKPIIKRLLAETNTLFDRVHPDTVSIGSRIEASIDAKDGIRKLLGVYLGNGYVWLDKELKPFDAKDATVHASRESSHVFFDKPVPHQFVLTNEARMWYVGKEALSTTWISKVLPEKAVLSLVPSSEVKTEPNKSEFDLLKSELAEIKTILLAMSMTKTHDKNPSLPWTNEVLKDESLLDKPTIQETAVSVEEKSSTLTVAGLALGALAGAMTTAMMSKTSSGVRVSEIESEAVAEVAASLTEGVVS